MYTPRHASPAVSLASVSAAAAGRTLRTRPGLRGPRRHDATSLSRGVDSLGRFIGPKDFERGFEFFCRSRSHLRPVARDSFENFGGKGTARRLQEGLDFAGLRAAHRRCVLNGENKSKVAAALGISVGCLKFHLRGSASMRAALAEGQRQAA